MHNPNLPRPSPFADCSCTENLAEVERFRNYRFIKGDIRSADLVNFVLEEEEIDTIMHFAAQTHVDNSFGNSFLFTQNNILGTHVLLESAKVSQSVSQSVSRGKGRWLAINGTDGWYDVKAIPPPPSPWPTNPLKIHTQVHGIKRFIHVSTDEVYGEGAADQEPMFEDQVLEPTNPYAATKAGAEFIAKSYCRSVFRGTDCWFCPTDTYVHTYVNTYGRLVDALDLAPTDLTDIHVSPTHPTGPSTCPSSSRAATTCTGRTNTRRS